MNEGHINRLIGLRDGLIEKGKRITHRALGRAGQGRSGIIAQIAAFFCGNCLKMLDQQLLRHPAQVKPLAAGQDRHRNFANFRGGKDELYMRRRLFQRFQQAVERSLGEHVHFVDDKNFIAGAGRAILHAFDNVANVVNAGVAGRVHLDHVYMARFDNGLAVFAQGGHVDRWRCHRAIIQLIIEAPRHDARRGGFADPPHAG